jgi:hypothetical protein|nr:MAG TPA: hypothetical protein [Caudoviricetes sp.]DAS26252.1 MAG TPA: hypothetical protein [Caudoviricetes sp.]
MKNNKVRTEPTPQAPVHYALMQAHGSVYRAIAEIRSAGHILRKQHDLRDEPNNLEQHIRLVSQMQEMLYDIQRLIGCSSMRYLSKSVRHE